MKRILLFNFLYLFFYFVRKQVRVLGRANWVLSLSTLAFLFDLFWYFHISLSTILLFLFVYWKKHILFKPIGLLRTRYTETNTYAYTNINTYIRVQTYKMKSVTTTNRLFVSRLEVESIWLTIEISSAKLTCFLSNVNLGEKQM